MEVKTKATFIAYSGTNPEIKALVGQSGFEVEVLSNNCLQVKRDSLEITTSPIIATKTARAFEYEIITYKTHSGTEYQFSVVAQHALQGILKHF